MNPSPMAKALRKSGQPSETVRFKVDGSDSISPDHPDMATGTALLMEALGTTDIDFLEGLNENKSEILEIVRDSCLFAETDSVPEIVRDVVRNATIEV